MSRHRNVRSMNVEEECEHYDDIYGHSYDDYDYCTSPGTAALYMYDRSKANQQLLHFGASAGSLSDKIDEEEEYQDDDEGSVGGSQSNLHGSSSQSAIIRKSLSPADNARLNACLEAMQNVLGENFAESSMMEAALECQFDANHAVDRLLNPMQTVTSEAPKPQRKPRERKSRAGQTIPTAVAVEVNGKADLPPESRLSGDVSRLKFTVGDDDFDDITEKQDRTAAVSVSRPSVISSDILAKPAASDKSAVATSERMNEALNEFSDIGGSAVMVTPKKDQGDISPSVATTTIHKSASKAKFDRLDVQKEFEKRKSAGKDYVNLVVIGHVDAGKSTLMGHLLYQLGFVSKKAMHKFEQDSRKAGKGSFAYAWVLDETEEERSRGVTMDIAQTRFETPSKVVTLLDAPGHKDFIPNMITGAAQADVAILVINATKGEFETGFEMGGQTREHTMLARSLGVSQLLVAINKMDTVDWSQSRYDEIVRKLGTFLRQAGFKDTDLIFVPCSGLVGDNLTQAPAAGHQLSSWYSGPTLAEQIDRFRAPLRPVLDKPLRMCLTDVFKAMGAGLAVAGTIQAGSVQAGDRIVVIPAAATATVKGLTIDDVPVNIGFAGDNAVVTLTGIDVTNLSIGSIVCDPASPIETTTRFRARIVVFNINFPITRGFPVVLHYQSLTEQARVCRLISQLHRNTGEISKKKKVPTATLR